MRRYFAFLAFMFFCAFTASAQQGTTLRGKVSHTGVSSNDAPGATITLLRAGDSVAVRTVTIDKAMHYEIHSVSMGSYKVLATAAGYQKYYTATFDVSDTSKVIYIPVINLLRKESSLTAVTVTAKRPMIEHKIDRMVFNVDAAITNEGANALELLEKVPGVSVDKDGNISLKGKEGVLVLIDGRPTQLSGTDLANLLRNMNSSQLDQLEVMTNPPARFDAAGNAGIINIKTKKNKAMGYNGSLSFGFTQGRYAKGNEGFNFNHRAGKVNIFTNLSHNYHENFGTLTIQRNLRNSNTKEIENFFDQRSDKLMSGRSVNARVGMDYFLSKNSTAGITFMGFSSPSEHRNINATLISSPDKDLQSVTKALVNSASRWENSGANVYFRTQLDTSGKELSIEFDAMGYSGANNMMMVNAYLDAAGRFSRTSDSIAGMLPQAINVFGGRVDYTHPIRKDVKLEAGIKSSFVSTDNNAMYDSILNGARVKDFNRSNHFLYEEYINAAYLNFNSTLSKKWSIQTGLRYENTRSKGNQLTTGESFQRNYSQLFPTVYLQYKIDQHNNLGLNFGRRTRRPNYESLNPFIRFMDRYTYTQGNPDLRPEFSNNVELTHIFRNVLTTTINYSKTKDIIQGVIEQKGEEAYAKQANIASMDQLGLSVSFNKSFTKSWTSNLYFNLFNNHFEGIVNNESISFSATSFVFNGSQQFKVSKSFSFEVSGYYRSGRVEGVIRMKPIGMVSGGISQQMFKNKGTIRLTVRDIFYSQRSRAVTRYGNVDASFQEVRDSQTINLGFSYRFSKGKMGAQRKRGTGSATEEQGRISVN